MFDTNGVVIIKRQFLADVFLFMTDLRSEIFFLFHVEYSHPFHGETPRMRNRCRWWIAQLWTTYWSWKTTRIVYVDIAVVVVVVIVWRLLPIIIMIINTCIVIIFRSWLTLWITIRIQINTFPLNLWLLLLLSLTLIPLFTLFHRFYQRCSMLLETATNPIIPMFFHIIRSAWYSSWIIGILLIWIFVEFISHEIKWIINCKQCRHKI